ncbi:MAG: NrsF family protein [Paracraurococcus sp.]
MDSERLIESLATELRPVRRLPPPGLQALLWIALAVLVNALAVALEGVRPDLHDRMLLPAEVGQFLASIATGIAAALAAAMLARPDRSAAWALVPVLPLVLWLGNLGWGCFADLARMGPAAWTMGTSWGCLKFIVLMGAPLTAALLVLLRHAGPVRPLPVLLLGGLASAALCSAGLSLFHHLEAALMVLVWHGGALAVVVVVGWRFGGRLLLRAPTVDAAGG